MQTGTWLHAHTKRMAALFDRSRVDIDCVEVIHVDYLPHKFPEWQPGVMTVRFQVQGASFRVTNAHLHYSVARRLGLPYVQESLQLLVTSLSSVRLCPASGDVTTSDDGCQMRLLIGDFNQAAYGGLMRVLQDRGLRVKQLVRMEDEPCDAFVEEAAGPAAVGMAVSDGARLLTKGAHHPLAVTLLALLPPGGPGAAGPGSPGAAGFHRRRRASSEPSSKKGRPLVLLSSQLLRRLRPNTW